MNESKEINIWWEGPFSINDVIENKIDKKKYKASCDPIGLYQIYGSHPLYGDGVLVYIGRTLSRFDERLKNRWETEFGNDTENIQIYLGTLLFDQFLPTDTEKKIMIEKSEVLLINSLKPAFNSSNIKSVKKEIYDNDFVLYNYGNYRKLYPILDSRYFWKDLKNYIKVNELKVLYNLKILDNEWSYGIELKISDGYKIWLGVDYDLWDKKNIPLCLQVYSDNEIIMKKLKNINELEYLKYNDEEFSYKSIPVHKEVSYYKDEIESLKKQIKAIL